VGEIDIMFTPETRAKIRRLRKLRAERGVWRLHKDVEISNMPAAAKRLNELALALILPRPSGFPQYFGTIDHPSVWEKLLKLTAEERYPWQQ
jgi:hypothetical protein